MPWRWTFTENATREWKMEIGVGRMKQAFVGLGSNIEPRNQYLNDAIQLLQQHKNIQVVMRSSVYETEPVGFLDQASFLNMVVEVETTLSDLEFLDVCQSIELELGRERTFKNGPRTVDLDILLFNNENKELEKLKIPHPRLAERAFVLVPLYEIAPRLVMPTDGQTVKELLHALPDQELHDVVKWEAKK